MACIVKEEDTSTDNLALEVALMTAKPKASLWGVPVPA